MASTYLKRTNGTPTNDKIGTISVWFKRSKLGSDQRIHMNFADSNNYGYMKLHGDNYFHVVGVSSGSESTHVKTTRLFRDTNAWYHLVVAIDTTQATASDRTKFYINGVQETSLSQSDYPSQNLAHPLLIASGSNYHTVGAAENGTVSFDGSMSHFHKCDGTALAPTVFGSTDSTTGEWKINTSPSFTVGNTGYTILKDGNTITDQSTNSNNFTVGGGTLTKTEDCPSNVFATFNPLFLSLPTGGLSNGNTTATTAGADSTWRSAFGNLGATSGKYYMEVKWVSGSHFVSGFASQKTLSTHNFKDLTDVYSGGQYFGIYGTQLYTNGSASGSYTTQASGNIIQLALDMDNKKIYQGINGTWNVGGNPSSGNGISISGDTDEFWTFGISTYSNSGTGEYHANFGNGYFATTAVSSNSGNGYSATGSLGIFQYQPPTGYTALSTKGLNL